MIAEEVKLNTPTPKAQLLPTTPAAEMKAAAGLTSEGRGDCDAHGHGGRRRVLGEWVWGFLHYDEARGREAMSGEWSRRRGECTTEGPQPY